MKKGFLSMVMVSIFLSASAQAPAAGTEEGTTMELKKGNLKIMTEQPFVAPESSLDEAPDQPTQMGNPDLVKEGALEIYWMEMKLKIFFA